MRLFLLTLVSLVYLSSCRFLIPYGVNDGSVDNRVSYGYSSFSQCYNDSFLDSLMWATTSQLPKQIQTQLGLPNRLKEAYSPKIPSQYCFASQVDSIWYVCYAEIKDGQLRVHSFRYFEKPYDTMHSVNTYYDKEVYRVANIDALFPCITSNRARHEKNNEIPYLGYTMRSFSFKEKMARLDSLMATSLDALPDSIDSKIHIRNFLREPRNIYLQDVKMYYFLLKEKDKTAIFLCNVNNDWINVNHVYIFSPDVQPYRQLESVADRDGFFVRRLELMLSQ